MQYLLLGIAALLLYLVATRAFVLANPAALARQVRLSSAALALGASAILMLRGAVAFAAWLAALGLWLLTGRLSVRWPSSAPAAEAPQTSRVTTDYLDVVMDHANGSVTGQILRGAFKDRPLESLRPIDLAALWSECQFADPQSAHILEAYLDRMHPDWRDDMRRHDGEHANDRRGDRTAGNHQSDARSSLTREEAFEILGLEPTATEDDIRRAHRILMLKLHPDRGGSHALAAKVNLAKDVLLAKGK